MFINGNTRIYAPVTQCKVVPGVKQKWRFKAPSASRELANCTRGVNKVEVQGSIGKP